MMKKNDGRKVFFIVLLMTLFLIGVLGCDNSGSGTDNGDMNPGGCGNTDTGTDTSTPDTILKLQENSAGFCLVDGTIDNNYTGFTGTGFANTTNAAGNGIQWAVDAQTTGAFTLKFRYANGSGASRAGRIIVNGSTIATVDFNATDAWDSWSETASIQANLSNGNNRIVLQATSAGGLANIDAITINGGNISPGDCNTSSSGGNLEDITLWIAGDSTVANGSSSGCPVGWGRSIASYFDNQVTVQNLAVGGRSVRTWLYDVQSTKNMLGECVLGRDGSGNPTIQQRWQTMLDNMQTGDYLLIQFGINDGDPNCPRHVGTEAFKEAYGMMARAAKARGAHPVFITPVSAIRCSGSTAVASRGFIDETFEAGNTNDVPVLDLHAESIALYNSKQFCPIPGGDVSASTGGAVGNFFCDDHTHFSASGASEIAGQIAQALREKNIPLSDYLK